MALSKPTNPQFRRFRHSAVALFPSRLRVANLVSRRNQILPKKEALGAAARFSTGSTSIP